jgi:hypothetical protein
MPFEADYTCTPRRVTERRFMAAMAREAGREKLIRNLRPGVEGGGFAQPVGVRSTRPAGVSKLSGPVSNGARVNTR